jgi:hypothetical protein
VRLVDGEGTAATGYLARVLDEATGGPLAGARVTGYEESATPMPGIWKPVEVAVSDRDGWVLLRDSSTGDWHYCEAEGFGPVGEMGARNEFVLRQGADFPFEVRDWLDRPVPGAVVEVLLGCGHTPDVQSVTTDARGRAVLRCIDPTKGHLWVRAPGASGRNPGYDGVPADLEPGPGWLRVLLCGPSPAIEGVVLDRTGKPVAGAAVGTRDAHRGPWTRTDAEGRFRLLGAAPFEELSVEVDPPKVGPQMPSPATSFETAPGVVTTVRLGPPRKDEESGEPAETLRITLALEKGVRPSLGWERVVLVREGDGRVSTHQPEWTDGVAEVEAEVPPGRWTVKAGRRGGQFLPAATTVEVGPDGAAASIRLREAPRWKPLIRRQVEGNPVPIGFPWPGRLRIAVEDGFAEAVPVPGEPGAVFVPAEGPFVAAFEHDDGAEGRVRFDGPPSGDGPELVVPPASPGFPEAQPRTGDWPDQVLAVMLPDGSPAAAASCDFEVNAADLPEFAGGRLAVDGPTRKPLRRGDHIRIRVDGEDDLAPLHAVIDGPGPWIFRWPGTRLAISARDEAGAPVAEFTVLFEGRELRSREGFVILRGMAAGPVRFWVAAPGCRAHDVRFLIRAGDCRAVAVRLRH